MNEPYWCALSADELGQKLSARTEAYGAAGLGQAINQRIARAYAYFYGMGTDGVHATSQILRGGDAGELSKIRVNHTQALLRTLLNLVVAPKLVWTCQAINIDYATLKETELAEAVLEYYHREKEFSKVVVAAMEEALWACESYVLLGWDENAGQKYAIDPDTNQPVMAGDLTVKRVSGWNVLRDVTKESFEALDWHIVRMRCNRYDLVARFPDKTEDILEIPPDRVNLKGQLQSNDADTDDIQFYLFLHKRTAALPQGRECYFLQPGTVLRDSELTFDDYPLYRLAAGEQVGTSFGYSPFLDILGIQELYDSLHTTVASNQSTFSGQVLGIEDGSDFSVDSVVGGMRPVYYPQGGKPPVALELCKTPPEVFNYLHDLKSLQELVFGLNSVVRGEPQSGEQSGSALALLQSQALQQSSVIQSNYVRFFENLGTGVLHIIQQRASIPQKIAIVGKTNSALVTEQEVTGSDISNIRRVQVDLGSPASQTPAGRAQMAEDLMSKNLIKTPEQYLLVLTTGRLEPLTSSLNAEMLLIKSENEALQKAAFDPNAPPATDPRTGQPLVDPKTGQPEPQLSLASQPPVLVLDDHMLHAREHRAVLASPEARRNPAVVKAVLAHIDQHEKALYTTPPQTLAMVGQQSPMGLPQPGGPPVGAPDQAPSGNQPGAELPSQPNNPKTGQRWDSVTAGGAVPPAHA